MLNRAQTMACALLALFVAACDDGAAGGGADGGDRLRDGSTIPGDAAAATPDAGGPTPLDAAMARDDGSVGGDAGGHGLDAAGADMDGGGRAMDAGGVDPGRGDASRPDPEDAGAAADVGTGPLADGSRPAPDGALPEPDASPPPPPLDAAAQPPVDAAPPEPDFALLPGQSRCQQGPGRSIMRFIYGGAGADAVVEVWDLGCEFLLEADGECTIEPRCSAPGCRVNTVEQGRAVLLTTGNESIRIRFSTEGMMFEAVTLYAEAVSRDNIGAATLVLSNPRGAEVITPVFGGAFRWYSRDWTEKLRPGDGPDMARLDLAAGGAAGSLALRAFEICVE